MLRKPYILFSSHFDSSGYTGKLLSIATVSHHKAKLNFIARELRKRERQIWVRLGKWLLLMCLGLSPLPFGIAASLSLAVTLAKRNLISAAFQQETEMRKPVSHGTE